MYACAISDILEQFAGCRCVVLGDVTYGACCVDDLTAKALGCELLVHYGHSCLVPIAVTAVKVLYVFVEVSIDTLHLAECIRQTFEKVRALALPHWPASRPDLLLRTKMHACAEKGFRETATCVDRTQTCI